MGVALCRAPGRGRPAGPAGGALSHSSYTCAALTRMIRGRVGLTVTTEPARVSGPDLKFQVPTVPLHRQGCSSLNPLAFGPMLVAYT